MGPRCRLQLHSEHFDLDLEGDADFIRHAYLSLRDEIIRRVVPVTRSPSSGTMLNPALQMPDEASTRPNVDSQDFVWIYRCNDLYCKVGVAEREAFKLSTLGRVGHSWRLRGIYLESDDAGTLTDLVPSGEALWSELMPMGRERLRKE